MSGVWRMCRVLVPALWVVLVLALLAVHPAGAAGGRIDVLSLKGVVNPTQASYIARGIDEANEAGAELVVIGMDTPGGLDSSMRSIIQAILESEVPVAVYVIQGGRAASAGTFITMASHVAAMAPGTAIGAAHPVGSQGEDIGGTLEEKATNDAAEYIRSLAKLRGRNADWAADEAVRQAKSLDAETALEIGVVEFVEPTLHAFLDSLDGYQVSIAERQVALHTQGAELHRNGMNLVEQFLFAISDTNIAYILLSLAMLAIFFELSNPGAILPGVIGGIGLLMSLYALGTLQANWAGVLLIGLAFILFVAEIFVTSGGVLGVGGVVSFIMGSLMLWGSKAPPGIYLDRRIVYSMAAAVSMFFLFIVQAVVRAHRRRPATGAVGLVGETGVAKTPLEPEGTVLVEGELWGARAADDQRVEVGDEVEVVEVKGLRLRVKRKDKGGLQ